MDGWTDKTRRLPDKNDTDAQNCVLVWHIYSGAMVYRADGVETNCFITHWMKLPGRPAEGETDEC